MTPLTDDQRDTLTEYLSRNPKQCKCGGTAWNYGDMDVSAADLDVSFQEVKPHDGTYVHVTCQSCGEEDSVDCAEAGISDDPQN